MTRPKAPPDTQGAKPVYLGKGGRAYGPFDSTELKRLKDTGEIHQYTYLWNPVSSLWEPFDPPPPPPENLGQAAGAPLEAICHDSFSNILSGSVRFFKEGQGEFVTDDECDSPRFGKNASLMINTLKPNGEANNIKAILGNALRIGGQWVYRFHFQEG